MRCTEARRKLRAVEAAGSSIADHAELLEHLKVCPACARQAEAARLLRQDFAALAIADVEGGLPFESVRTRIEARAAAGTRKRTEERNIMTEIARSITRRPRLGVSVGLITVIILISIFVPFKYHKTIGYEVAFAGVDKDLAMDQARVQAVLAKLGVTDTKIDVSGCDTTCIVTVSDIKTPEDAKVVIAAFERLSDVEVAKGITPVWVDESGNIIEMTANRITLFLDRDKSEGKITQIITDRLGDSVDPAILWVQEGVGDRPDSLILIHGDSSEYKEILKFSSESQTGKKVITLSGDTAIFIRELPADAELKQLRFIHDDGRVDSITLNPDGLLSHDSAADKGAVSELPAGFELSQNYPNPFNPTTTIGYSLPASGRVKLEILNVNGQVVRTLVDGSVGAGRHSVEWNATSDDGSPVASGVYIYRLTAGDFSQTKKMSFIK